MQVTTVICDMVERHYLRGMVAISGKYGCEVCKRGAQTRGGVQWPYPKCTPGEERCLAESILFARQA